MIVCVCRNLSDAAIRAELDAGARTADDLARATGAGTDCGCCRDTVEALVLSRSPCAWPPCAGCPRAVAGAAPTRRGVARDGHRRDAPAGPMTRARPDP